MSIISRFFILVFAFIISCISSFFNFIYTLPDVSDIKNCTDIKISSSQTEFYEDTHGGFHGDGEKLIVFTPNRNQITKIETEWEKTPLNYEIASFFSPQIEYNELKETVTEKSGYWVYKTRGPMNYTLVFFDGDKVYYYELDC